MILAGGTMKPYETLKEQLLVELKTRETDWFNCAHVISSSQMKAMVIKSGISNHKFEFNYSNAQGRGFPQFGSTQGYNIFSSSDLEEAVT